MDNINFTIDSKDKNKLSRGGKIFHYFFGSFLILIGVIGYFRAINGLLYTFIIVFGIIWIVKGLIGKEFFITSKRHITIRDNKLSIKISNKAEMVYAADVVHNIKITAARMDIGIKNDVKSYDLKWLSYSEFQELKDKMTMFCNYNKIEIA